MKYWVGVASADHVALGVRGRFCQLGHGKSSPLEKLSQGDWITYYAPREGMESGAIVQAFVALGQIEQGPVYAVDASPGFRPARRAVRYLNGKVAPIRPLLEKLSFVRNKQSWGMAVRRSSFEITEKDFRVIASAMGVDLESESHSSS